MILITFLSILLTINNVKCGVISIEDNLNVERVARGAYKFNHPPSAEYISVPVAVFYEEGNREEKSIKAPSESTSSVETTESTDVKVLSQKTIEDISDVKEKVIETSNNTTSKTKSSESQTTTSRSVVDFSGEKKIPGEPQPKYNETAADVTTEHENTDSVEVISSIDSDLTVRFNTEPKKIQVLMPHDELIIPVAVVYDVEPEYLQKRNKPQVIERKKVSTRQQRKKKSDEETEIPERENVKSEGKRTNGDVKTLFPRRTQGRDPIIPIVQMENYVFSHSGDFHYSYEGGDGTKAFERGLTSDNGGEAVEGSFSYIGKDGKDYSLTYTADENGYRPVGDHLPTPPPIPPAIARALKYLATKPTPEGFTESYQ